MAEIDREKVVRGLEVSIISDTDAGFSTIEIPVRQAENILSLLKEHEQAMKEKDGTISNLIAQIKEISQCYERVVRCKDCKYGRLIKGMIFCHKRIPSAWMLPDWFCADGRKKDGETKENSEGCS